MGMRNQEAGKFSTKDIPSLAKQQGFSVVESFSGPGGMSLGLEKAGFELRLAFDYNEKAVETHCFNLGNKCIVADAANITGSEILERITLNRGELDLFAGGPPCQGFSKQKRGAHLGDERNQLVSHYIRLVKEIQPRFFLFENVAIFGQKRGQQYIEEMFEKLTNYTIYPSFYNAADYGLAQTRQRFVLVGRRNDIHVSFQIPKPTVQKRKTIREVIGDLPEPPEDYSEHPKYPNHQRARVTEINIKRFSYVPPGGGWQDIPQHLRLKCHQNTDTSAGGWPDVYGRLTWEGQCPTITGGFDSFTRGRYGHPKYDRPITPREAARIQGFPDNYIFIGSRGDVRSQIGNAVPPPLAEAVGIEIARSLLCFDGLIEDTVYDPKLESQLKLAMV
jgi:DNA (cytosine-5)-methyltransferase 1